MSKNLSEKAVKRIMELTKELQEFCGEDFRVTILCRCNAEFDASVIASNDDTKEIVDTISRMTSRRPK